MLAGSKEKNVSVDDDHSEGHGVAAGDVITWPTAFGVDGLPKNPFWSDVIRNWRTGWDIGA